MLVIILSGFVTIRANTFEYKYLYLHVLVHVIHYQYKNIHYSWFKLLSMSSLFCYPNDCKSKVCITFLSNIYLKHVVVHFLATGQGVRDIWGWLDQTHTGMSVDAMQISESTDLLLKRILQPVEVKSLSCNKLSWIGEYYLILLMVSRMSLID